MARILVICPSSCIAKIVEGECLYVKTFRKCLYPEIHPNIKMYCNLAKLRDQLVVAE